ncbi:NUDIX hydrolase [Candidatus Riflebacteria bacterium]
MRWKTHKKECLFEGRFVTIEKHIVDRGDGNHYDFEFIHYNNEAVGIIPFNEDKGEILLVKQYRYFAGDFFWEIPAGGIDSGESAVTSATRELIEETGYAAKIQHYFDFYPSVGGTDQLFHIFLATNPQKLKKKADPLEILELSWFSYATIKEMILTTKIRDGLTLGALARFFLEYV